MKKLKVCELSDLVKNSGVCALLNINGIEQQVALFHVPDTEQQIYAINNWDPIGKANVLSRGIVGTIGDELVVASPLYKQHFSLLSGKCLEDESANVLTFDVSLEDNSVYIAA